ncbi:MAG: hypothetical protein WD894_14005 [Pirellulales bacterium]
MARRLILALLVGFVPAAGCTTCDNPYDDCGPVVDADFHPAGFRAGSRTATPMVAPETIPTPPPPPMAPADENGFEPDMDEPPEMEDMDTTSVMRPRLRYAR